MVHSGREDKMKEPLSKSWNEPGLSPESPEIEGLLFPVLLWFPEISPAWSSLHMCNVTCVYVFSELKHTFHHTLQPSVFPGFSIMMAESK